MRKKLTPIFRQISDAATPKLVKRMAEISPVQPFRQAFRRLTKAYSGGFVGVLQQLKHRISWAHVAFNGTPTHPSIYRASLSNANGVVCALVRKCCLFIVVCPFFFLLVIRWNPDLFFVGPFPNDVGYSRSCFPEKKSKKSDSIDYLCPSSYDGIGKWRDWTSGKGGQKNTVFCVRKRFRHGRATAALRRTLKARTQNDKGGNGPLCSLGGFICDFHTTPQFAICCWSWTPCEKRFIWDFFWISYIGLGYNFIILQLGFGICEVVVLQDLFD